MSSKLTVKRTLEKAGVAFEACWTTLTSLRNLRTDEDSLTQLLTFQPRLARAIHGLDRLHLKIKARHRATIANKATCWPRSFRARLRVLDHYDEVACETLAIGKALGDGFVWFFYSSEKELLKKHLQHPLVKHTSGGIGGDGELAFIEHQQVVNGHFVIYHGNTSILRIGDVSFLELSTFRVAGLGELKSHAPVAGAIDVRLHLLGRTPGIRSVVASQQTVQPLKLDSSWRKLPPKIKDQLQRQMKAMTDAFHQEERARPVRVEDDSTQGALTTLVNALNTCALAFQKCGDGLLLMGMRQDRSESFTSRMFGALKKRADWNFGSMGDHVRGLLDSTQSAQDNWNSFGISRFFPATLQGTIPFCSWRIDHDVIRQILFQEIVIVSIYNPAHLVRKLQAAGFDVRRTGSKEGFSASKPIPTGAFTVSRFDHFLRLITDHFISEEGVIQLLLAMESKVVEDRVQPNTMVDLTLDLDPSTKVASANNRTPDRLASNEASAAESPLSPPEAPLGC